MAKYELFLSPKICGAMDGWAENGQILPMCVVFLAKKSDNNAKNWAYNNSIILLIYAYVFKSFLKCLF